MSVTFFIGPYDPIRWKKGNPTPVSTSSLKIDPLNYRKKLLARWPTAREYPSEYCAGGFYWALDEYNLHGIEIHIQKDLQHVAFERGEINFLDFIMWHRAFVSDQYQLYLFNSSSWDSLLILPDTTREQVIQFTGILGDDGLIKDSPINGSWDGSFMPFFDKSLPEYRCTLHLLSYFDHLDGALLIAENVSPYGSMNAYLRGEAFQENGIIYLERLDTTYLHDGGVHQGIQKFQSLDLNYLAGSPPKLEGSMASGKNDLEETVGELHLRRQVIDYPPSG
jgi:hypothetical protein